MKISKTQLKKIIKEELETVLSEEGIEEGLFGKMKKAWKNFRMTDEERTAAFRQKLEDEFAAKPRSEQNRLKNGYKNHELSREESVGIPYSVREWGKAEWDERDRRDAERREYQDEQRQAKEAERRGEFKAEMARWKRQQDADDEREAYRSRDRYTGGSLDGEGSPSAPWDE